MIPFDFFRHPYCYFSLQLLQVMYSEVMDVIRRFGGKNPANKKEHTVFVFLDLGCFTQYDPTNDLTEMSRISHFFMATFIPRYFLFFEAILNESVSKTTFSGALGVQKKTLLCAQSFCILPHCWFCLLFLEFSVTMFGIS